MYDIHNVIVLMSGGWLSKDFLCQEGSSCWDTRTKVHSVFFFHLPLFLYHLKAKLHLDARFFGSVLLQVVIYVSISALLFFGQSVCNLHERSVIDFCYIYIYLYSIQLYSSLLKTLQGNYKLQKKIRKRKKRKKKVARNRNKLRCTSK